MAKKLIINCAGCDTRKALQENYEHYESITINAATVLTNASGKAFLNALPVTLNCAKVIDLEDDVDFRSVNGHCEIKRSDRIPEKKFVLLVNGSLTIESGTEQYLQQCAGIIVNGSALYPESIAAYLGEMTVNGCSSCYPDGAIILKRHAVIDRLFALRAKKSLYWSTKRMVMVDPELNPQQLHEKGCTFAAETVIIAKSKVEPMIDLIDEKAEIVIVPDGTVVVPDDLTLDSKALHRYGEQLYVIGDITVPEEDDCLDQLQYLTVLGDANVPAAHQEKLLNVLTAIDGEIKIAKPKGSEISDLPYMKVTKWMLDLHPAGLEIRDCTVVKISSDLTKEMIVERLRIIDCDIVKCSEAQEDAVSTICKDVGQIRTQNCDDDMNAGNTVKSVLAGIAGLSDTKVINAADYVL